MAAENSNLEAGDNPLVGVSPADTMENVRSVLTFLMVHNDAGGEICSQARHGQHLIFETCVRALGSH